MVDIYIKKLVSLAILTSILTNTTICSDTGTKNIKNFFRIHTFGDSHSWFAFTNGASSLAQESSFAYTFKKNNVAIDSQIFTHWLGPVTMHRIGRDGFSSGHVIENDIVVFVFGEIDVRCHIGKQRDEHARTLDEIITTLCTNYIKAINNFKCSFKKITCFVCQVMPPTNACYNPSFPFYGSLEDRAFITKTLNKKLQATCIENDLLFLDCFDPFTSKDGTLITELSDNCVHIRPIANSPVKEKLFDVILEATLTRVISLYGDQEQYL